MTSERTRHYMQMNLDARGNPFAQAGTMAWRRPPGGDNRSPPQDFAFWDPALDGRNDWRIEELLGAHKAHFPHPGVWKYFVTSQRPSIKKQLVTLKDRGYWDQLMDETKPDIVVGDWFHCGCPCRHQLCVQLLSARHWVLEEFCPKDAIIEQRADGEWREVSHTFHQYRSGVRHVLFKHGGQGWYGLRVTHSSIMVMPEVRKQ